MYLFILTLYLISIVDAKDVAQPPGNLSSILASSEFGPGSIDIAIYRDCGNSKSVPRYCYGCALLVICADPKHLDIAEIKWCENGEHCDSDRRVPDCVTDPNDDCDCSAVPDHGKVIDSTTGNDESWYIDCSANMDFYYGHCSNGYFDENIKMECVNCPTDLHTDITIDENKDCFQYNGCEKNEYDGAKPVTKHCPPDMFVSDTAEACADYEGKFYCTKVGVFKDPIDCRRYQVCDEIAVQNKDLSTKVCCLNEEVFDDSTKTCVKDLSKCNVNTDKCIEEITPVYCNNSPPPTCSPSCSFIPDIQNCHKFYKCVEDANGNLQLENMICEWNYVFSEEHCTCLPENMVTCSYP